MPKRFFTVLFFHTINSTFSGLKSDPATLLPVHLYKKGNLPQRQATNNRDGALRLFQGRYAQNLARIDFIRMFQHGGIGFKDDIVLISLALAVLCFGNFPKRIA